MSEKTTSIEDQPLDDLVAESKRLREASESIVVHIQKIATEIKNKVDELTAQSDSDVDPSNQPVPRPEFTEDQKKPKPR